MRLFQSGSLFGVIGADIPLRGESLCLMEPHTVDKYELRRVVKEMVSRDFQPQICCTNKMVPSNVLLVESELLVFLIDTRVFATPKN